MTSPHGTYSRYSNDSCRCDECRLSHREGQRRRRAERYALVAEFGLPDSVAHGKSAYNNWGCRCDTCRTAASEYCRGRRL